ncbi:MAG: non-canonical purine NTP pyrophosphatase [Candidatus Shapirobacteria bacterium]|nr:non-canonical purine NTP pyrophosphatase [Candidatus Shapirobacteria bacterium]MDD4410749.1 non-canonical purine NTP pyrophosphatase [Candidatus Shapirobacteria bacterium]
MNKLYFATSNSWKFNHANDFFKLNGIGLKQFALELPESRSEDVEEIAKEKAEFAYSQIKKPVFVIDAAFYINGLNGFPKTYVKYAEKYIGANGIIKLLKGNKDRTWEVDNVICYKNKNTIKIFHGKLKGIVSYSLKIDNINKVREVDRIFIPENYKKTYSEFTKEEQTSYDNKIWKPKVFDEFISWIKNNNISKNK